MTAHSIRDRNQLTSINQRDAHNRVLIGRTATGDSVHRG
jgi:hypothetical protein